VQAQAAITSTHGHPRLIWPVRPKFNKVSAISFICVNNKLLAFIGDNV